jgi:hypothetical protein
MSDDDNGFDDFFDPYDGLNDLTGDEHIPALEEPAAPYAAPPRSPLLTGLVVLLLLVVLTFAFFQLLTGDSTGDDVAATSTTAPDTVTTTGEPGDGGTTTTTEAGPTTTAAPDFDPFEPRGQAVAIADLKLQVDAIGPILLGSPARQSIGQLISSLGDPDEDTGPITSTGAFGGCEGGTVRIVRWGALAAIVVIDDDGAQTFGGYRVDLNYDGALTHPTADLQTLSGLQPGASVREIDIIYENFSTRIVADPDLGDVFEVSSANTGNLLLWGPVTSTEDAGRVDGIYAPNACGRFQQ